MLAFIIILLALIPPAMVWFLSQGAPFVRTSKTRTKLIKNAARQIKPKRIIDLGCGDGKLVIAMAMAGYKVDGIEIQPQLVWRARRNVKRYGLENKVKIYWGSFWKIDISKYSLVMLFGAQHIMPRLERKLFAELPPSSYIISNTFTFPNIELIRQDGEIRIYKT
jgi:16S rRNA A1518/A1519 N6-dimethyltransferase RsmA/KsgA/DIM1 with predicted DNA glycosylase/AP lyase activity